MAINTIKPTINLCPPARPEDEGSTETMSLSGTGTLSCSFNPVHLKESQSPKATVVLRATEHTPRDVILFTGYDLRTESPLLSPTSLEIWETNKHHFEEAAAGCNGFDIERAELLNSPIKKYLVNRVKSIGTGSEKKVFEGRSGNTPVAVLYPRAGCRHDILRTDRSPIESPHLACNLDKIEAEDGTILLIQKLYKQNAKEYLKEADEKNLLERCIKVAEATSKALRDLHANGYIHRDVKFANIFVSANEEIVLGDFGGTMKVDGKIHGGYGTPGFKSPEIARGGIPTTHSDMYSLGVMCQIMADHIDSKYDLEENGDIKAHSDFFHSLVRELKNENMYGRLSAEDVIGKIDIFRAEILGEHAAA